MPHILAAATAIGLALGSLLVSGCLLQVACGLAGVECCPRLVRAVLISLAGGLVTAVAASLLGVTVGLIGVIVVGRHLAAGLSALLVALLGATFYSAVLRATWWKGLAVWSVQALVLTPAFYYGLGYAIRLVRGLVTV